MQKLYTLLFLLVATSTFAQKTVLQQAAYTGFSYSSLSVGYDARFRTTTIKPDFSLGATIITGYHFGFRPHAAILFGKGSNALEMGVNANFQYSRYNPFYLTVQGDKLNFIGTSVNPYIGYRYQPKNKHFFLQIQHAPFMFYNLREYTSNFINYAGLDYKSGVAFALANPYNSNFANHFALHLGMNINRLQDTLPATNSAYEAPKARKLPLQHAFALGFYPNITNYQFSFNYDLRLRIANAPDIALDIAYAPGGGKLDFYNRQHFNYAVLALFGAHSANFEAGVSLNTAYFNNQVTTYTAYSLGIPLGFRFQPNKKDFFMRIYAMPYKQISDSYNSYTNYPENSAILDNIYVGTAFGYTF
jgi:hypothetical protein